MDQATDISANVQESNPAAQLPKLIGTTAVLPALCQRYTRDQIESEIEQDYGIVTLICSKLDCTPKQLYNALDKYELRENLKQAKQQLIGIAEKAILECMRSDNETIKLRAAETTLKSLGKDEWNQGPAVQIAQQINIADEKKAIQDIFGIK